MILEYRNDRHHQWPGVGTAPAHAAATADDERPNGYHIRGLVDDPMLRYLAAPCGCDNADCQDCSLVNDPTLRSVTLRWCALWLRQRQLTGLQYNS
jgi:hypothetical protein